MSSASTRPCLSSRECLGYLEGKPSAAGALTVQQHLDACDRCRVLVAETARATFPEEAPSSGTIRTLVDGEKLGGRYVIRRFIARGGMGEVYEAFDTALSESVALKTLSPTTLDQVDAAERLVAEVRLARKVTHPNVCRILEFGVHRRERSDVQGIPFLTMELLVGETLANRLRRAKRLAPDAAKVILREIAAGLSAVHKAGIVHRDFKPENVFLVRDGDGSERALVMDFGLARALQATRVHGPSSSGALSGTLAYMAPEQIDGHPATPAFDVYALGTVAFELLTGQLPFRGDTAVSVATVRLRQEAPRPSTLRPELGASWDAVIDRCLACDPRARFASMGEVAAALDGPALAPPPSPRGRAVRRAVIVGGVAILGLGVTAFRGSKDEPVRNVRLEAAARAVAPQPAPAVIPTVVPTLEHAVADDVAGVAPPMRSRRVSRQGAGAHPRSRGTEGARSVPDAAPELSAAARAPEEDDDAFIDPFPDRSRGAP